MTQDIEGKITSNSAPVSTKLHLANAAAACKSLQRKSTTRLTKVVATNLGITLLGYALGAMLIYATLQAIGLEVEITQCGFPTTPKNLLKECN